MKNYDIVYSNNQTLGYIKDLKHVCYSKDEKAILFDTLKKELIKKDYNRKLFSLIIGLLSLFIAISFALLMIFNVISLGTMQWFYFTFILVALILFWVLFYYIFGFIFYSKIKMNIYFKNPKLKDSNFCVEYASSFYYKWINKYIESLSDPLYSISEKKDTPIAFGLKMPSKIKNLIFNGHINLNIPYYYFAISSQRILFLPGMIVVVNGKKSDVFSSTLLNFKQNGKEISLYKNEKLLLTFKASGEFDINFFHFKYEQI